MNNIKKNCHYDIDCTKCEIRSKLFCSKLKEKELMELSGSVAQLEYPKDTEILSQGDDITHIYNVVNGMVKVYQLNSNGDEQIIGFLYPGDFFGSHEGGKYDFYTKTIVPSKLCRIPLMDFKKYLANNLPIYEDFYSAVINELKLARTQINILAKKNADDRVIDFFKIISKKQVSYGQPESPVTLAMSRSDIANYLGLTTESVSRSLTRLKIKQILRAKSNNLFDINLEGLWLLSKY